MANLYYLLSSLPTLTIDKKPGMSYIDFLDAASRSLNAAELAYLKSFNYTTPPASFDGMSGLAKLYWEWEISLRNELVRLRAEALHIKPDSYLHPCGSAGLTTAIAKEAFRENDPLSIEKFLTKVRYDWLESQKGGHVFNFDILLIYAMQLQLLERYYSFDESLGRENYHNVYQRILGKAESILLESIA